MVTIIAKSDQKCFICEKSVKTVEVRFKDKSFQGVLCLEHVYAKLKEKEKDEPSTA